jgi:photosystem II stability/assembly factor-like uncharacterized protein
MRSVMLIAILIVAIVLAAVPVANAQVSWSTVGSPAKEDLFSVFMVTPSDGWAVGEGGMILHYTGSSWSTVTSPTIYGLQSVFMVSASEGWAVGVNGLVLHYSGGSWITATSPTGEYLQSVFMVSASEGWAVGDGGTILHYSGGSWITATSPTIYGLQSVFMVSASEGWAVGQSGTILHYSGGSWTTFTSPTTEWLVSLFMVSASDGWAVGLHGTIIHYADASWNTVASPIASDCYSVFMVNAGEGWAVGHGGTILHYSGGSWTTFTSPTTNYPFSVFMVGPAEGWAVGQAGTILHYGNSVSLLHITSLSLVPDQESVGQGSKVIFTVTVQNTGINDISSAKVQVKIYKPGDTTPASSPYKYISNFKAGTERTVDVTYTLSSTAPLGDWTYAVYVYRSSTVTDQVPGQGFKVQPAVKTGEIPSVVAHPNPVGAGGATAFTVTFENTGNIIWPTAKLTLNIFKPSGTRAYATRSLTVSNIVPGVEYSGQVKWTPSSSALLGGSTPVTYTYDMILTYKSTVLYTSAGNTVTVEPIMKTGVIISVDAPSGFTRPGTVTFTVKVMNTGNTIWSSGKVTVKIYKPSSASVYTTKSLSLSNIVPGVEYAYNIKWPVSSSAMTGTYAYDVCFYYGTKLTDSDVGDPSNTITIN